MTALVRFDEGWHPMFKFEDCVATWHDETRDSEGGYGANPPVPDKHGSARAEFSYVAGQIGGSMEVVVYPMQFGLPAEPGTKYDFKVLPKEILFACVQAVREEHYAPEYVI